MWTGWAVHQFKTVSDSQKTCGELARLSIYLFITVHRRGQVNVKSGESNPRINRFFDTSCDTSRLRFAPIKWGVNCRLEVYRHIKLGIPLTPGERNLEKITADGYFVL
jgi:hypothetical protein